MRTAGCGICRTDLHMLDGLAYRPALPHILGHEPRAASSALGDGVVGWAIDDAVAPYLFDTCGHCSACRAGSEAQCEHQTQSILGVTRDGGFAEYLSGSRRQSPARPRRGFRLPKPGWCPAPASPRFVPSPRAQSHPANGLAVIGAGGIGLLVVQCLVHDGIDVHVVETSETMRRRA